MKIFGPFFNFLFFKFWFRFFSGRSDTSGSMMIQMVPDIEGGTLSLTEKKKEKEEEKDWSWSILVVGLCDLLSLPGIKM